MPPKHCLIFSLIEYGHFITAKIIQDSKFKIQDSRFKIQDSKFKIQDSRGLEIITLF